MYNEHYMHTYFDYFVNAKIYYMYIFFNIF